MPMIRSLSDLSSHTREIADFCRKTSEPVLITHPGEESLVLMSAGAYERQETLPASYIHLSPRGTPSPAASALLLAARQLQECLSEGS